MGQTGCAALASLRRLRCLELSYCDSLSDTPVCELTLLSHLTELSLAGCASITDIAVTALVRVMPALVRLDLSACHLHVGDISLYAIATLPKLQVWFSQIQELASLCEWVIEFTAPCLITAAGCRWLVFTH